MYLLNSKASEYMIRAMVYLSSQRNREGYIMVKEISEKTEIPQPFLSKIFQDLAKTSWIQSKKGKNGGVKLIGDTKKISLLDIINFSGGAIERDKCIFGHKECGAKFECSLHGKCDRLKNEIHGFLSKTTIDDFSKKWDFGIDQSIISN